MTEILVQLETTVPVGEVLARIAVGAEGAAGAMPTAGGDPGAHGRRPHDGLEPGASPRGAPPPNGRRYSPVVQRIAAEHDIDLNGVTGTGRGGRVRKQDVLAFLETGAVAAPAVEAPAVEDAPLHIESPYRPDPAPPGTPGATPTLSRMRRQIGEHMKRSLETAATCTTWIEVDLAGSSRPAHARRHRAGVRRASDDRGAPRAPGPERVARGRALHGPHRGQPRCRRLARRRRTDRPGDPCAHELSEEGLGARIKDLARRARARELTPDEVRGGTFTITNPGQYGSIMATPIINQPQVAILDLEAIVKRPVVLTDAEGNDSIAIRPMTILGLSWDHRALDGALAAQFLASVKRHLEGVVTA